MEEGNIQRKMYGRLEEEVGEEALLLSLIEAQ